VAHDVFISYAVEDKPTADAACATLEARRIRCWIAPRDVLPGMDYAQSLVEAINQSRVMVLIFSARSNHSPHVRREVERAVSAGIPILPFRIEDVSPSPSLEYFIATAHWLDALTPPLERHLKHLAETVKLLLARIGRPEQEAAEAEAPEAAGIMEPTIDEATHKPTPLGDAYEIVKRWSRRHPIVRLAVVFGAAAGVVAAILLLVVLSSGDGDNGSGSVIFPATSGASTLTVVPTHPTSAAMAARPSATTALTPQVSPTAAPVSTPTAVERSPKVLWRFKTGFSFSASPPVVVDQVAYIGDSDGVYALDAATGEERWRFDTGHWFSAPALKEGAVYVGGTDIGADEYYLYALDAATGEERWRLQLGGSVTFPTVVDGVVYLGSDDNYVYALDSATGKWLWRFKAGFEGDVVGFSDPAVADGVVYIGGADRYVYALDASTGELRWRHQVSDQTPALTVVERVVYVSGWLGGLRALDSGTGEELWVFGSGMTGPPAVADGIVYVGSSDGAYALDAATGEERWLFHTDGWFASPVVVEGVVYVTSHIIAGNEYYIYALDAAKGEERWRFQTGGTISSPAVAHGVAYIASGDGYLYALDTTALEERWVPERPSESGP
jgi:outer membrane protein assembly factor BamB